MTVKITARAAIILYAFGLILLYAVLLFQSRNELALPELAAEQPSWTAAAADP